jgi:predicted hydrocarbon binding protein
MKISPEFQMNVLLRLMDFLGNHPLLVRVLLRPVATAPFISRKMMVLPRAFMGATAFEIHDVDYKNGRIGIGGVEEIMAGAKIIHLLHTVLADKLGEVKKNKALYEIGVNLCKWEVSQALEHGRWAPAVLTPLIFNSRVFDEIRTSEVTRRFLQKVLDMMSRLITDEGGWGHLDFDFSSDSLKVVLTNSQEARWLGKSDAPVCHFYAGIVAGYASTITNREFSAREVACKATGAEKCVFELSLKDK